MADDTPVVNDEAVDAADQPGSPPEEAQASPEREKTNADFARERIAKKKQRAEAESPKEEDKPPTLEEYGYDEKAHNLAMLDYAAQKAASQAASKVNDTIQQNARLEREARKRDNQINTYIDAAKTLNVADYNQRQDAVMDVLGDDVVNNIMALRPKQTATLIARLGANEGKEDLKSLKAAFDQSPVDGTLALGALLRELELNPKQSNAPTPDSPVSSAGASIPSEEAELSRLSEDLESGKIDSAQYAKRYREIRRAQREAQA